MTFEGKAKRFWRIIIEEWNKSYMELIALYVHPKNSNHLRSHLRAIMALDQSRLGMGDKFLENKSGRIFCVRQVYFIKSCQPIWWRVTSLLYFYTSHLSWNSILWGTVFTIQASDRMQLLYFTILQDKLHSFNIQDDGSTFGLLARALKNFQKHLQGQPVLTFDKRQICSASCQMFAH